MLGNASDRAELVGVYERFDEIETSKVTKHEDEQNPNKEYQVSDGETQPIEFSSKGLNRENSNSNEIKPEWREFWAHR